MTNSVIKTTCFHSFVMSLVSLVILTLARSPSDRSLDHSCTGRHDQIPQTATKGHPHTHPPSRPRDRTQLLGFHDLWHLQREEGGGLTWTWFFHCRMSWSNGHMAFVFTKIVFHKDKIDHDLDYLLFVGKRSDRDSSPISFPFVKDLISPV